VRFMKLRKHKIKEVGDGTWNLHVNDHVLLEWEQEDVEEGEEHRSYQVFVFVTFGPYIIEAYVFGSTREDTSKWEIMDINFTVQSDYGKDVIVQEFENIELPLGDLPDVHTWVKMAAEKGAFDDR
jgi:hypothetical protein